MKNTAVITLSEQGLKLMKAIQECYPDIDGYIHDKVETPHNFEKFNKAVELTARIFTKYKGLIFIAPTGAVVRAISSNIENKHKDPAVVQIDVGGRWVVSLLSGHEGGANDLALKAANCIGAEPVISTSTEAAKNIIVGVGCRKGKSAEDLKNAIETVLQDAGISLSAVRYIASADVKKKESGLIEAAEQMRIPLRFIASQDIRQTSFHFDHSKFVTEKVKLPAVAEPSALLAGRSTSLIVKKRTFTGITVAIARENCMSLE